VRAWGSLAVPLLASLALAACAAPSSYMGISFAPGAAASNLQDLARRAQAGDKQAQLDLGIAYEEGRGDGVDLKRAEALYWMAAADTGRVVLVHSLPYGNGAHGRVLLIQPHRRQAAIPEARKRLETIRSNISE
jgi:TPR repeat protein